MSRARRTLVATLAALPLLLAAGAGLAAYKNLTILPKDISERDMMATMTRFNDALGVDCFHCHVSPTDFVSDAKPAKGVSRRMLRMTLDLNRDYFDYDDAPIVTCMTCHNGQLKPQTKP